MSLVSIVGDILNLEEKVEAIVVPANNEPVLGNALDSKIYKMVGRDKVGIEKLLEIRKQIGKIEYGKAEGMGVFGFEKEGLKFLVHTATPTYIEEKKDSIQKILESCYTESIKKAYILGCKSIAFPILSSGTLGWPMPEAKVIAEKVCKEYTEKEKIDIKIYLVEYKFTESWCEERREERLHIAEDAPGRGTYNKTKAIVYREYMEYMEATSVYEIILNRFEEVTGEKFSVSKLAECTGMSGNTTSRVVDGTPKDRDYIWAISAILNFNPEEITCFFEKFCLGPYELADSLSEEIRKEIKREKIIKEFLIERNRMIDMQKMEGEEKSVDMIENWKEKLDCRLSDAGYRKLFEKKCQ